MSPEVWHKLAEALRLHSESTGVGELRRLTISLRPPAGGSEGGGLEASKEAKKAWASPFNPRLLPLPAHCTSG